MTDFSACEKSVCGIVFQTAGHDLFIMFPLLSLIKQNVHLEKGASQQCGVIECSGDFVCFKLGHLDIWITFRLILPSVQRNDRG